MRGSSSENNVSPVKGGSRAPAPGTSLPFFSSPPLGRMATGARAEMSNAGGVGCGAVAGTNEDTSKEYSEILSVGATKETLRRTVPLVRYNVPMFLP